MTQYQCPHCEFTGNGLKAIRYHRAMKHTVAYDYQNQAWTLEGVYVRCNHPEDMNCACYGKLHEGERVS